MIITGLLITTVLGYCIINYVKPSFCFAEKVAAGYGLGFAIVTLFFFIFSLTGIAISVYFMLSVIVATATAFFILSLYSSARHEQAKMPAMLAGKVTSIDIIMRSALVLAIVALMLYFFAVNSYWPVHSYDGMSVYDNLAKVFFSQRNAVLDASMVEHFGGYVDYPLHVPLMNTWIYLLADDYSINPKYIYALYYVSLLTIFYFRARRHVSINKALLGVLALATAPGIFVQVHYAETNFVYPYYLAVGIFYLHGSALDDDRRLSVLGAAFLAVIFWVRPASELIYIGIATAVCLTASPKIRRTTFVSLFVTGGIICILWKVYLAFMVGGGVLGSFPEIHLNSLLKPDKLWIILRQGILQYGFLRPVKAGIIWPAFVIISIMSIFYGRRENLLALCYTAILLCMFYFSIYLVGILYSFNSHWLSWFENDYSFDRLVILFQPLMIYCIVLMTGPTQS